jgi:hypothetical protein
MQKINMLMGTMGTMGHYRLYVALLQSSIDSPGFADADSPITIFQICMVLASNPDTTLLPSGEKMTVE